VTWRIRINDTTHSYVWHDAFIHSRATTHSWMGHDTFIRATWRTHMTHSYVCHDAFTCVAWCIHMCAMSKLTLSLSCTLTHTCTYAHGIISKQNKTKQNKTKQNKKASRLSRVKDISKLGHLHLQALLLRFTQADTSGEVFLRCVLERCNVLQCVAVWCSVLQCVVVCCSVSSWYL